MKYKSTYPEQLIKYSRENTYFDGSVSCISNLFKIDRKTFYDWVQKYPEFAAAVEETRDIANEKIESALFKAAFGYNYSEHTTKTANDNIEEIEYKKHQTPNIAALKLWLTNRKSGYWKDCQDNTEGTAELVIHIQNDIEEK